MSLTVNEERLRVWPPWPWPPWGPEDPDNPDDPDRTPINRTEEAKKLAKGIIAFEKKIANASLDLDVLYQDPIATYNPVPYKNVSDALPEFDFSTYFSAFAPRNFPSTIILTSTTYLPSLSEAFSKTSHEGPYAEAIDRGLTLLAFYVMLYPPNYPQIGKRLYGE